MASERHYTHAIVSYAELKEIRRLLDQAKAWAYILHNKDEGKAPHYHIIATFSQEKTFKWVREQVISTQNTFAEAVHGDIEDVFDYFIHQGFPEKYQYDKSEVVLSDEKYWNRRIGNGENEESKNEQFMDDLLSDNFSAEAMGRKYGRDFIKNFKSYKEFRDMVRYERKLTDLQVFATDRETGELLPDGKYRMYGGVLYPIFE